MCDLNKIPLTERQILELLEDCSCDVFSDEELFTPNGNVSNSSDSGVK